MKVLVAVVVLAAFLQADARSIGMSQELPKVLRETMEQSMACALDLGPDAKNMPRVQGLQQLPEDNAALNQLWGCIFVKKGIINHDNEVNSGKLHTYLLDMFTMFVPVNDMLRSWADEMTEACKVVHASDYKIKSIKIQNCINRNVQAKTGM